MLFIILIGIILLVVLIGYSLSDRENMSKPEKIINDTVGWVQSVVHKPVNYVTGFLYNIKEMKNMYQENQILKEKLAEYKGLIYEVQEVKEENEELRKLLDKPDSIRDYRAIDATVIARSPEKWIEQVTINRGEDAGVASNMAVITPEGMIGKVLSTSKHTATVQLLTGFDQFNRISATISRKDSKNIVGLIEEYDKETDSLIFRIIEESDKNLKEGELVVSSGMGGVFPAGLPIGEVKEVVYDQYGLTRTALVKPSADMYEINQVVVVDRGLPNPEKDDTSKKEDKE